MLRSHAQTPLHLNVNEFIQTCEFPANLDINLPQTARLPELDVRKYLNNTVKKSRGQINQRPQGMTRLAVPFREDGIVMAGY